MFIWFLLCNIQNEYLTTKRQVAESIIIQHPQGLQLLNRRDEWRQVNLPYIVLGRWLLHLWSPVYPRNPVREDFAEIREPESTPIALTHKHIILEFLPGMPSGPSAFFVWILWIHNLDIPFFTLCLLEFTVFCVFFQFDYRKFKLQ